MPGISAVPDEGNARYFHVVVAGKDHLSEILSKDLILSYCTLQYRMLVMSV